MMRCATCKGTNIQTVCWVKTNSGEVIDDFGSWDSEDTKWCEDCDEHTPQEEIPEDEVAPPST
jgi:hypothetical protein